MSTYVIDRNTSHATTMQSLHKFSLHQDSAVRATSLCIRTKETNWTKLSAQKQAGQSRLVRTMQQTFHQKRRQLQLMFHFIVLFCMWKCNNVKSSKTNNAKHKHINFTSTYQLHLLNHNSTTVWRLRPGLANWHKPSPVQAQRCQRLRPGLTNWRKPSPVHVRRCQRFRPTLAVGLFEQCN